MLRVIEYFPKSLKITQDHWKRHHSIDYVYEFLLTFYSNCSPILCRFRDKAIYWSKITIFGVATWRWKSFDEMLNNAGVWETDRHLSTAKSALCVQRTHCAVKMHVSLQDVKFVVVRLYRPRAYWQLQFSTVDVNDLFETPLLLKPIDHAFPILHWLKISGVISAKHWGSTPSFPSTYPPFPFPLEVGPLNPGRGSGERCISSPAGSGTEPRLGRSPVWRGAPAEIEFGAFWP